MPYISEQTITEVLLAASVQEVVGSYVTLKKAGSGFKGLCPFHSEKSPSFNVNPGRQIFKCFGCGKGGNVVKFIMEIERTDYPGAVALLADRFRIPMRYEGAGDGDDLVQLYRIHETAAQFFRRSLGDRARAYLSERGVTDATAEQFGLGYAPAEWDALLKRLRAAGYSDKIIRRSGLVVEKEGSDHLYDRFRDRLIFPIHDGRGKVVAFGGRAFPDSDQKGGKYINSPETPIFRKARMLYGQHLLDRDTDRIVVVEGYFDVILPWQNGLRGVVAPMGTAFGQDHVGLVRRYARRCVLLFDADAAGRAASDRGLDLLLGEDLDLCVGRLEKGDPADADPATLSAVIDRAPEVFDFLLDQAVERRDLSRTAVRSAVAAELLDRVARLEDPVRRDLLIQKIAERLKVDVAALRAGVRRPERAAAAAPPTPAPRLEKDALRLIRRMLDDPAAVPMIRAKLGDAFEVPAASRLARAIYALVDETGALDWAALQARLPQEDELSLLADAQMLEDEPFDLARQLDSFSDVVQRRQRRTRKEELMKQMREAQGVEKDRIAVELSKLGGS